MEIYILLNHNRIGPFSQDATQTLLRQGTVSPEDLAWRPGMPEWLPLREVLDAPAACAPDSVQPAPPILEDANADFKPATEEQRAFLRFFATSIPDDLSLAQAEELTAAICAEPAAEDRLALWYSVRTRLHPELFPPETPPKKSDRADFFLDCCQTAGATYFTDVTKAHCEVLLKFLDVKFPRWGANEAVAVESYFFPAIAEKFPQLVNKSWRGRLHYREGPVSTVGAGHKTTKLHRPALSPFGAIFRGFLLGLLILALLYAIHRVWQNQAAPPPPPKKAAAALPTIGPKLQPSESG